MLRLDAGQFDVLQSIMENESVLVTGGAGTGKTVLALALARELADEGKRALVLCFTEPLASWLRQQIGAANPVVGAVKRYAAESLEQAGRSVTIVDSPEFWSAVAMKAVAEALPKLNAARDAVVVDEGQDLAEDDQLPVERLSEGKRLWAFWDPEQAFWRDRRVRQDRFRTRYRLQKRYRCPEAVLLLAGSYLGEKAYTDALRQALEQKVVALRPCAGADLVAEQSRARS